MKQNAKTVLKVLLTVAIVIGSVAAALTAFILTIFVWGTPWLILTIAGFVIVPSLLPFVWLQKRKKYLICWISGVLAVAIAFAFPVSPRAWAG